jgi:hypothetical protein
MREKVPSGLTYVPIRPLNKAIICSKRKIFRDMNNRGKLDFTCRL